MKKFLPALLTMTAISAVPVAMADGWYAEAGYTNVAPEAGQYDVELGAFTARGGHDFTENLGVELEGAIGVSDGKIFNGKIELNYAVGAYGKAQLPLGDKFDVFARAGIVSAQLEVSGLFDNRTASETGAAYGVGGTYSFSEKLYVRGDYTRYEINALKANAFSLALGLRF